MPSRSDALLLADIVENAEAVAEFVKGHSYEALLDNREKLYAVVRAFEIIGEAAKGVSAETKARFPQVEWRLMTDFRNVLIHQYFGIDYEALWTAIHDSLPPNLAVLKHMVL